MPCRPACSAERRPWGLMSEQLARTVVRCSPAAVARPRAPVSRSLHCDAGTSSLRKSGRGGSWGAAGGWGRGVRHARTGRGCLRWRDTRAEAATGCPILAAAAPALPPAFAETTTRSTSRGAWISWEGGRTRLPQPRRGESPPHARCGRLAPVLHALCGAMLADAFGRLLTALCICARPWPPPGALRAPGRRHGRTGGGGTRRRGRLRCTTSWRLPR